MFIKLTQLPKRRDSEELTAMKTLQLGERDDCSRVRVLDTDHACWRLVHVVDQHGVLLRVHHRQVPAIKRADGLDHSSIDKRRATRLPVNDVCMIVPSEVEQDRALILIFDTIKHYTEGTSR